MNLLSFFATLALAITIIEGLFILLRNPESVANRLFFGICLCISIWLFGCAFGYSSSTSEEAFFWLKVASPGYIFMHALILHFVCRFTKIIKIKWIYLIYLPSLVFLYISLTDHLVFSDIHRAGKYWVMVPDYHSITFYMLMTNYLSYYFLSLLLLYINIKKTKSNRIRSQSRIIFAAIVITITSYNIEPFLAPIFFDYNTYGQASIYSIVWISFIWYAMDKYRFLGIYENFLPFDLLDSLNVMVVITDMNKKVIKINRALRDRLQLRTEPLFLKDIFAEHELVDRMTDAAGEKQISDIKLNIIIPEQKLETVTATLSVFKDRFGDTVGFIITAREIADVYSVFQKRGITEREFQLIQLILSGNSNRQIARKLKISLRTVETHITNIFNKLGLKNRSELINYCVDLFSLPTDL